MYPNSNHNYVTSIGHLRAMSCIHIMIIWLCIRNRTVTCCWCFDDVCWWWVPITHREHTAPTRLWRQLYTFMYMSLRHHDIDVFTSSKIVNLKLNSRVAADFLNVSALAVALPFIRILFAFFLAGHKNAMLTSHTIHSNCWPHAYFKYQTIRWNYRALRCQFSDSLRCHQKGCLVPRTSNVKMIPLCRIHWCTCL